MAFLAADQDNSDAATADLTVLASMLLKVKDVIATLFSLNQASGTLRIKSDWPLVVTSHTYNNVGAAGAYGQCAPASASAEAIYAGDKRPALSSSPRTRCTAPILVL